MGSMTISNTRPSMAMAQFCPPDTKMQDALKEEIWLMLQGVTVRSAQDCGFQQNLCAQNSHFNNSTLCTTEKRNNSRVYLGGLLGQLEWVSQLATRTCPTKLLYTNVSWYVHAHADTWICIYIYIHRCVYIEIYTTSICCLYALQYKPESRYVNSFQDTFLEVTDAGGASAIFLRWCFVTKRWTLKWSVSINISISIWIYPYIHIYVYIHLYLYLYLYLYPYVYVYISIYIYSISIIVSILIVIIIYTKILNILYYQGKH